MEQTPAILAIKAEEQKSLKGKRRLRDPCGPVIRLEGSLGGGGRPALILGEE